MADSPRRLHATMAYFKVICHHLLGGMEESSVWTATLHAKNLIWDLQNAKKERKKES
jgi:hypothetical protein